MCRVHIAVRVFQARCFVRASSSGLVLKYRDLVYGLAAKFNKRDRWNPREFESDTVSARKLTRARKQEVEK